MPLSTAPRARLDADGTYTGELDFYCYGENKAIAMREHADRYGIDLSESYAYSDSATDAPMLQAVGHPHAVNPDKELRALATANEWPILSFTRPVSLRSRIASSVPRPSPVAALAAGTLIAAALAWAALRRRSRAAA